jgi:multidrug resistance efflux pump
VIARIDDGDYQLAVETAKDNVATEQATINRIDKQIAAQRAAIDQAKAQLASSEAGLTRAELELKRQQGSSPRGIMRAVRRSSRRKPTGIRPPPLFRARRQGSMPRKLISTC